MEKRRLSLLLIGLLAVVLLALGYIWCDEINAANVGISYDYERAIRAFIVALIAIIVIRILFLVIITPIERKTNVKVPNLVRDIIGVFVLIVAAIFVITQVYSQSAMVLFVGLGASGLGIAYIAQDFLKELFAGVVIAFQNDFRVGDWVRFPDGKVGMIIRTKLSGVDLMQVDETVIYIPNTAITGQAMINLNQPERPFYDGINVVLDHDVQVDRARRILFSAISSADGMEDFEVFVVATEVHTNGTEFGVFYKIPSYSVMRETRHKAISAIMTNLHKHNLHVCEITGQYNVRNVEPRNLMMTRKQDFYVTDEVSALKFSGLLKGCSEEVISHFAQNMTKLIYPSKEIVCSQGDDGDTMFIIAEGVVDVMVEISVTDSDGEVNTTTSKVATLADGDYFGEMALLCGEKRGATVKTRTDVVIYEIKRETVKAFITKYQDFARKLSTAIVERNMQNEATKTDAIERMTKKENSITEFMKAFKVLLGAD